MQSDALHGFPVCGHFPQPNIAISVTNRIKIITIVSGHALLNVAIKEVIITITITVDVINFIIIVIVGLRDVFRKKRYKWEHRRKKAGSRDAGSHDFFGQNSEKKKKFGKILFSKNLGKIRKNTLTNSEKSFEKFEK